MLQCCRAPQDTHTHTRAHVPQCPLTSLGVSSSSLRYAPPRLLRRQCGSLQLPRHAHPFPPFPTSSHQFLLVPTRSHPFPLVPTISHLPLLEGSNTVRRLQALRPRRQARACARQQQQQHHDGVIARQRRRRPRVCDRAAVPRGAGAVGPSHQRLSPAAEAHDGDGGGGGGGGWGGGEA